MNFTDTTDTASEAHELNFPNQEHLSKAIAGGTTYQIGDRIFVVFILAEDDGCSICWAHGDMASEPNGQAFTRYLWLPSLEAAKAALVKVESIILKALAAETDPQT